MKLQLYFAPGACSFVPHCLLEASGASFEATLVKLHKGEQQSPEYLALNPRGQVPVLVADGQVITQIVAIVNCLHELFPEQNFLPSQPLAKARVMQNLLWMNNTAHPTFTHIFMPNKFAQSDAAKAEIKAHCTHLYRGLLSELEAMVQAARRAGHRFLGGEHFGPLDAYALTLLRWGTISGLDPQGWPDLWDFVQSVALHPPVARAIERERLQLNLYKG